MARTYTMATAEIKLIPTVEGMQKKLSDEVSGATKKVNKQMKGLGSSMTKGLGASFGKNLKSVLKMPGTMISKLSGKVGDSLKGVLSKVSGHFPAAMKSMAGKVASGIGSAFRGAGKLVSPLLGALGSAGGAAGRIFSDTFSAATKGIGTAVGIGLVGIIGQAVGGGFKRALDLNQSTAKLKGLGYQGKKLEEIMDNAKASVKGTSHTMGETVDIAASLLAAGKKPGKQLTGLLKDTGKLADISGASYKEMGDIMVKSASKGYIQMGGLNQIISRGVPIMESLSRNLGKSVGEIETMASAGKISFEDLEKAIKGIKFDSAVYAAENAKLAFTNLQAYLSILGEKLWTPIIKGAIPIMNALGSIIDGINETFDFKPAIKKINKFMKNINDKFDGFRDIAGKIDNSKVSTFVEETMASFKEFKKSIGNLLVPAVGLILGMTGKLLSRIPLIGGVFAGITGPVGIVAAVLYKAYTSSEKLKDSVKNAGKEIKLSFKNAFKGQEFGPADTFKKIGDGISKIVDFLKTTLTGVISEIGSRFEQIKASFDGLFSALSKSVEGFGGSGEGLGKLIGSILVSVFTNILNIATAIVPVAAAIAKVGVKLLASGFVKSLGDFVLAIINWATRHESVIATGIALLTAWFVGKKLVKPISGIAKFISKIKGKGVSKGAGNAVGKGLGGVIQGLASAMSSLVTSLPQILLGIAAAALIAAEIAGLAWLMRKTGLTESITELLGEIMTAINVLAKGVVEGVAQIIPVFIAIGDKIGAALGRWWPQIEPIISYIRDTVITVVLTLVDVFITLASAIATSVAKIAPAMGSLAESFAVSFVSVVETLAEKGIEAGAGAFALAGGLAAIAASLASGAVIGGLGNAVGGFLDGVGKVASLGTQKADTGGPLTKIKGLTDSLARSANIVTAMPTDWAKISTEALSLGTDIIQNMAVGLVGNSYTLTEGMVSAVSEAHGAAQQYLNDNPLYVEIKTNDIDLDAGGSSRGKGDSTTNKTNNFYASGGGGWLDTIMKAAR